MNLNFSTDIREISLSVNCISWSEALNFSVNYKYNVYNTMNILHMYSIYVRVFFIVLYTLNIYCIYAYILYIYIYI